MSCPASFVQLLGDISAEGGGSSSRYAVAKAFQAMEIRISFGTRVVNPFVARHYPTVGHAFFSAADEKADDFALALGT